jgi:hypothetical protein
MGLYRRQHCAPLRSAEIHPKNLLPEPAVAAFAAGEVNDIVCWAMLFAFGMAAELPSGHSSRSANDAELVVRTRIPTRWTSN